VRSFFVQIFLAFWVSTLATFVVTAVIFPQSGHPSPDNLRTALDISIRRLASFEMSGRPAACDQQGGDSFFVLDEHGTDVCGRTAPDAVLQFAARARGRAQREYGRVHSLWAVAQPLPAQNGKTCVAVLLTPFHGPPWFPHLPPLAIPISALVTFAFAYLLTNPVRALRRAFRRFAAGDMTVRLPVSRSPLRDWGGADVRTLMIDFNEMADRIQALVQAHKTLLRDVSHELRSPLARLNVALELAREDAGEASKALDRAELESSRLNALIGELLSLSLMETIQDVPNRKAISVGGVVESLMSDLIFEAEARQCRVVHRKQNGCAVLGNEELLRRAVENIIRNAIRYSPPDADVTVETLTDNGKAIVRVCDSGPGVPEESLQAIFRPFYRVDSARQTTTGGFGVGLAIAERTVHLHGGAIHAFNQQTGGLCVELSLPCARPV